MPNNLERSFLILFLVLGDEMAVAPAISFRAVIEDLALRSETRNNETGQVLEWQ